MLKFLNNNDYFLCSGGILPAQIQNSQVVVGKEDGAKYLTLIDVRTNNIADFVCQKMVSLAALIASLIVASGGAALAAILAMAVLAGGVATLAGGLLCGFFGAILRSPWLPAKTNVFLGPARFPAITEQATMSCCMGGVVQYAPNIKTWWQAMLVSASNSLMVVFKCIMAGGAAAAFVAIAAVLEPIMAELIPIFANLSIRSFAPLAIAAAALRNLLSTNQITKNFIAGTIASWTTAGLGLRGLLGGNQVIQDKYVTGTEKTTFESFHAGVISIETGAANSVKNICTGQGRDVDLLAVMALFTPYKEIIEPKEEKIIDPPIKQDLGNFRPDGLVEQQVASKAKLEALQQKLHNPNLSEAEIQALEDQLYILNRKLKILSEEATGKNQDNLHKKLLGLEMRRRKINELKQNLTNDSKLSKKDKKKLLKQINAIEGQLNYDSTIGLINPKLPNGEFDHIINEMDSIKKQIAAIKKHIANPTLSDNDRNELETEINRLKAIILVDESRLDNMQGDLYEVHWI